MTTRKATDGRQGEKRVSMPARLAAPARRLVLLVLGLAAAAVAAILAAPRLLPTTPPHPQPSAAEREAAQADPLIAEALGLADQVVRDLPDDVHARFARGMIFYRLGLYEAGVESWRACLEADPQFAMAYYCLGQYAFEEGDYDKTVELMDKALQLDPEIPDALLFVGKVQMHRGELEKAVDTFRRHLERWPRSAEGHFRLGQAYSHLDRTKEALDCYRATVDIDPNCKNAYYGLRDIYRQLGQEEQARECQKKFESVAADWDRMSRGRRRGYDDEAAMRQGAADAHVYVGKVYSAHGEPAKAESHFLRAAEVCPADKDSRELLAAIYEKGGRLQEALALLEQLEQLEPGNADRSLRLAAMCVRLKRFDDAEKPLRRALEAAPQRWEAYAALAHLFLQAGREPSQARAWAEKAVQLRPTAENYYTLSAACHRTGDRAAAVTAMRRAAVLDPGNPQYRERLARLEEGK